MIVKLNRPTNNKIKQIRTTVKQLLLTVKFILYEEAIALGMDIDSRKSLGRSEP